MCYKNIKSNKPFTHKSLKNLFKRLRYDKKYVTITCLRDNSLGLAPSINSINCYIQNIKIIHWEENLIHHFIINNGEIEFDFCSYSEIETEYTNWIKIIHQRGPEESVTISF